MGRVKGAVAAQSEALLWNLGGGPEKNRSEFVRKGSIVVEISVYQIRSRPDTVLQRCSFCCSCNSLVFRTPHS